MEEEIERTSESRLSNPKNSQFFWKMSRSPSKKERGLHKNLQDL
jgi:hypothetical protein